MQISFPTIFCHYRVFLAAIVISVTFKVQSAEADVASPLKNIDDLLNSVAMANRRQSYEGLLTYEANGSLSTLRLQHHISNNMVYEQLEFLDGTKRQVVREQGLTDCNNGQTRWGLWPGAFNVSQLNKRYSINISAPERVANRQTKTIDLIPKDKLRYGYRFNIDQQTGLLLKALVIDKQQIIERTQFVSIELDGAKAMAPPLKDSMSWRVPEVDPCHTEQFQSAWRVEWLPVGFVAAGNRITAQGEQVLMFSDGLVSISVFIISTGSGRRVSKLTARRGATVAVISPLSRDKTRHVVVVGEIPPATARRIAVSIKAR